MTLPKDVTDLLLRAAALVLKADKGEPVLVTFNSATKAQAYRLDFYKMMKMVKERRSPLPSSIQEQVADALTRVQVSWKGKVLEFAQRGGRDDYMQVDAIAPEELAEIIAAMAKEKAELEELGESLLKNLEAGGPAAPVSSAEIRPIVPGFKYPLRDDN